MNLFLLFAVPLAAALFHRLFYPSRAAFSEPKSWILGAVWSIASLVAVTPFGKMREFGGNLLESGAGLTFTDAVLVPGLVVLMWALTRKRDAWELGLWLTLVFTMAGIRDFVSTTGVFDLNEYFLVPLDRVLLVLLLPAALARAFAATAPWAQVRESTGVAALVLTGPVFQVFSWGGLGWLVWLLLAAGLGLGVWRRLAGAISEDRPEQP